jgi:hypothetical protein
MMPADFRRRVISDRLVGYRAKIARAKEHLRVLKESIDSFILDRNAYSVIKEPNPETGVFVFRLQLHRSPPLTEWSLIIGDCIHNMRSALDHLFWQLVLLENPSGVADSTASFPILRDRGTFKGRKAKIEGWIGKRAAAMVENMQPYQGAGPDKNAFLFIHSRDITDKHKLLVPFVGVSERGQIALKGGDFDTPNIHVELPGGPLENGTIIATITVSPPDGVVDVDFNPTLGIVFETDPIAHIVLPSLEMLIGVVESVGGDFAPLFSDHDPPP